MLLFFGLILLLYLLPPYYHDQIVLIQRVIFSSIVSVSYCTLVDQIPFIMQYFTFFPFSVDVLSLLFLVPVYDHPYQYQYHPPT